MPAKLNFFKTPASERLVSSRSVSTSTGISGCFQPGQAKVGPGPSPLDTTCISTLKGRWSGEGYTLHIHTARGGERYTLHFHTAGCGEGYILHCYTADGGDGKNFVCHNRICSADEWYIPRVSCKYTLLWVAFERDTPCTFFQGLQWCYTSTCYMILKNNK